jgi:hypothetical protein
MYQGIYLIKEREFIKCNEDIYKIGKSNILNNRIKQYPKGSSLHLIIFCEKCEDIEKELIKLLTKKFKIRTEYGAEYFEGKIDKIINEIEKFMTTRDCIFCKINNSLTNTFILKDIFNNKNNNITKISYPLNKIHTNKDIFLENEDKQDIDDDEVEEEEDEDEDEDNQEIEDDQEDKQEDIKFINKMNIFVGKGIKHICKICNFTTIHKANYDAHLLTNKHKRNNLKTKEISIQNTINIKNNSNKQDDIMNIILENQKKINIQNQRILKQQEIIIKQNNELKQIINKRKNITY